MDRDGPALAETWRQRNAMAQALALAEEQMHRALAQASVAELAALIETFSPARAAGPEWTRSFEPLLERLWAWRDDATMAELERLFRARGLPWAGVANALSADHGARLRAALRHPAWARLPAFAVA
jgi:hypothetical protein